MKNKLEQKVDELERKLNDGLSELKVIKAKLKFSEVRRYERNPF